jgi:hypothetical protein
MLHKGESFKDLVVWQRAMQLSVAVYKLTALFPSGFVFATPYSLLPIPRFSTPAARSWDGRQASGHGYGRLSARHLRRC